MQPPRARVSRRRLVGCMKGRPALSGRALWWGRWRHLSRVPCLPATSPALFYLSDTRLFGPCTKTKPGSVPMTISSSPSGEMNRPKDPPTASIV